MMILKSISTSRIFYRFTLTIVCLSGFCLIFLPVRGFCKIYIDINSPSIQKINIAIPDFKDFSDQKDHPELATEMPEVVSNDLEISGYFTSIDKGAFLDEDGPGLTTENIRFRNWSIIGTELLLKCGYTCIGRSVEVEVRLYDIFWGRQILAKKFLGKIQDYRNLMHRIGNELIRMLTGHEGIFLTRIAFVNSLSGHKEIYIADFDGYNIDQITADKSIALLPAWSPDGNNLVFNSYKEGGVMLYLKNLSNNKVSRISGRKGLNIGARWLPDGKGLALTLSHEGNPDIYEIDLGGKIKKNIIRHWAIDVSPVFSPDGNKMAFVSNRSGSPQIYLKDLTSGNEERLTFDGQYNTSPAWSAMNRIAFSQMDNGTLDIWTMDADGGGLSRLTEGEGNNEDPCWSPDGRYIIFSSNRTGNYHLYIMTANGLNQRRITNVKGEQTAPSWSPF